MSDMHVAEQSLEVIDVTISHVAARSVSGVACRMPTMLRKSEPALRLERASMGFAVQLRRYKGIANMGMLPSHMEGEVK